jgi:hypothetical protein
MTDLKPCQFCGSRRVSSSCWLSSREHEVIRCDDCGGEMRDPKYGTYEEAREAWNRRAP